MPNTPPLAAGRPLAIVTGASSGIGRATAIKLAAAGYSVVAIARSPAALAETVSLCGSASRAVICDITDAHALRRAFESIHTEFGRIDLLVNNAGIARVRSIDQTTPDIMAEAWSLNTAATANAIHLVWPIMAAQRSGCIVNISSMAALDPFPGFFAYAASKAAVNMLTLVASREGSPLGIRCFCLCPGAVETPLLRSAFDDTAVPAAAALPPEVVANCVVKCVEGGYDDRQGTPIAILSAEVSRERREAGLDLYGAETPGS